MLEAQLSKSDYLATDKFTFADISGFVVCDFARMLYPKIVPPPKLGTIKLLSVPALHLDQMNIIVWIK